MEEGSSPMSPTEKSPITRLEVAARVTEIWSRILDCPIRDDQNYYYFYAFGGTRSLEGQVIAEINRSFGLSLQQTDLDGATWTIAKFTDLIFFQLTGSERSTVVPLRDNHGGRSPLFIVHGVGGNVVGFYSLAKRLDPDRPVYGIQAQALIPDREAVLRIQEMAAQYIEDMRAVWPDGPYNVLGFSYGGLVAYEIAQQLQAAGREVRFLGMLDTRQPLSNTNSRSWSGLHRLFYWRVRKACYNIYSRDDRTRYLLRRLKVRFSKARFMSGLDKGMVKTSATAHDVVAINYVAGSNYVVRPYPGDVVLFRAEEDHPLEQELPFDLGWGQFAGQLTVKILPGAHAGLMEELGMFSLAAEITAALEESESRQSTGFSQDYKDSQDTRRIMIEI